MFFLFPILFFSLIVSCSIITTKKHQKKHQSTNLWMFLTIFSGLTLILLILYATINFSRNYSEQLNDFMIVQKFEQREIVYAKKANALTKQFAAYLATAYPKHERGIFNSISPDGVDIYLAKYPELRSADTLIALVGEISKLQADRYDQQLQKINVLKRIRFRTIDPWNFYWWIPTLPEMEAKYGNLP